MEGTASRPPRHDILTAVGLICAALIFLESVADILPDDPWFWLITPSRAILMIGLVAMVLVAPRLSLWRTWLDIPLLVLLLAALASSLGRAGSMAQWRWLLTEIAFYYLVVVVSRTQPDAHLAALVLVLVGMATPVLVALQQSAAQTPTGFCRAPTAGLSEDCTAPGALVRVIGTFGNPNLLAAFLLLTLPLAWVAVYAWLNSSIRLAGWVFIAATYIAILQTWSRAGIAAAVLGTAALFTLLGPTGRRLKIGGLIVIVGFVAAVALVLISGAGVRSQVWAAALRLAASNPLGVGMGRAGTLIHQSVGGGLEFQHAHNTWLNWLVEAGWLGFLSVVAITVLLGWRTWCSSRAGSRLAAASGAGLFALALMSLADHPTNAARVALALAFVMGLLMSTPLGPQQPTRSRRHKNKAHSLDQTPRKRDAAIAGQPDARRKLRDEGHHDHAPQQTRPRRAADPQPAQRPARPLE